MNIKEQKGVTLFILVITVVILSILVTTVVVSVNGYGELKGLKSLANDLQALQEKVSIYYEKYGELPISNIITDDVPALLGNSRNENDGSTYYKVNLQLLDNIILTYGSEKFENDYFIINEQSYNIYYYAGLEANNQKYYGIKDVARSIEQVNFGVQSYELKTNTNATVTDGIVNIQLEVYADVANANISKYKFKINDEEWTPAQDGNSYVFNNLKQYETYKVSMIIIDNANNEIYATNNEKKVTIKELPVSLTIDGKTTGTYNNPLIPAGFVAINENNAIWQSSDGYKNGLVITDEIDENGVSVGNEFVWVPVDGSVIKFERVDFEKQESVYTDYFETVPEEITTSISKYGGFYIARYEAGKENINGIDTAVIKKGATVWNDITWEEARTKAEAMYTTNIDGGAISTLIYGTEWDTTLKFIASYDGDTTYPTASIGKGNYSGISGGDTTTLGPAPSGILEAFRQKNIYDMAGNVYDWTMEEYATGRVPRGGCFGDSPEIENAINICSAAYRIKGFEANITNIGIGFRVALYLK